MGRVTKKEQPPRSVRLIRAELSKLLQRADPSCPTQTIGAARAGIYAFFDYDEEPIYVGQTSKSFADRIGRHLTGQRSDAVAKFILDPFEVAYVAMWSLPLIADAASPRDPGRKASVAEKKKMLDPYEFSVYKLLEKSSRFQAVLNEGSIATSELVDLPQPVRGKIIPHELWEDRKHSDVRIARRASTIARLSQMISEREVSAGMRRTLLLQARRLEWLAEERVRELGMEEAGPEELLFTEDDL
jgi:GIY-YIG catalytic domain